MIQRYDVSCNLDNLKSGRYVLYDDYVSELAEYKKIEESLQLEIKRLDKELAEKDREIRKLEGWLKILYCDYNRDKIDRVISIDICNYLKAMELSEKWVKLPTNTADASLERFGIKAMEGK